MIPSPLRTMKRLLLLLALSPLPLGAEDIGAPAGGGDYPPPAAPFVAPVPAKAKWTITVRYEGEGDSAAPVPGRLRRIESERVGPIKRDLVFTDGGKPDELWFQGDKAFQTDSAGTSVLALDAASLRPSATTHPNASAAEIERGNLVYAPGFPGLDWVKEKYYDGVVLLQGAPCYHYVLAAPGEEGKAPAVVAEAWVRVKGGLPAAYAAEGAVYTFAFQPPPQALALPPAYQQSADEAKKADDHFRQLLKDAGVK